MQQAANVYARVAKSGETPRETEAFVLLNAAARLQTVCDNWSERQRDLDGALSYNRKVWTILSTSATADDNPLPMSVKQSIGHLALFIFKRTFAVMAEPAPEKVAILVSINRNIAAGLRATPMDMESHRAA